MWYEWLGWVNNIRIGVWAEWIRELHILQILSGNNCKYRSLLKEHLYIHIGGNDAGTVTSGIASLLYQVLRLSYMSVFGRLHHDYKSVGMLHSPGVVAIFSLFVHVLVLRYLVSPFRCTFESKKRAQNYWLRDQHVDKFKNQGTPIRGNVEKTNTKL